MAGISVAGIGSGLDLNGLVSQLIAAQAEPATRRLDTQEAGFQARISGYGTLKSALSDFRTAVDGLRGTTSFNARTAGSSDTSVITASADGTATPGSFNIDVTQLAQSQKLASKAFTGQEDIVGEGQLTFRFGTYDSGGNTFTADPDRTISSVTIDSSNSTLAGIRDAVNAAGIDVSASIVNDGSGERLVFGSMRSGAASSMEIIVSGDNGGTNVDDSGLSQLAFDPTAAGVGTGKNLSETATAKDANLTIDGLAITRNSNTVTGAIEGVTLDLASVGTSPATVTVSRDLNAATTAVQGFVDAFNALNSTFDALGGFDASTQTGGILLGDSVLRSVESNLRNVVADVVDGLSTSDFRSLADIGITTEAGGNLTLNSAKLQSALNSAPDAIAGLFGVAGIVDDSTIEFVGADSNSPVGRFTVEVTALATRGQYTGAAASSLVVDGNNSSLALEVDGITTGTIALTEKTYASESALAAELQAQINSDAALAASGKKVSVTFSGGNYLIQSDVFGSSSAVNVLSAGVNSAATLGISTTGGTSTAGTDVAGLIGNQVATGSGQTLTGVGIAAGLKVDVTGGAIGQRGTLTFSRGVAEEMFNIVGAFLDPNATLETSLETLADRVGALGAEREALATRLQANEDRLRSQFAALDVLLAQLQTTSTFLGQQLAQLPGFTRDNK